MMSPPRAFRPIVLAPVPAAAGALVMALGGGVMLGWLLDIQELKSLSPTWATMKVNTAACFLLTGLSLWLLRDEQATRRRRHAGRACAAIVVVIAVLTLGEFALGADFGIDQLLMRQPGDAGGTSLPGRMSLATAVNFVVIGLAFLGMDWQPRVGRRPALVLFLLAGTSGLLAFTGYLYGVTSLYSISPYSAMAVHSAVAFAALAVGGLCCRAGDGPLQIVTSSGPGGDLIRWLLPFAITAPLALGWLRLAGQRVGFYDFEFGLALYATSNVLIFTLLIWLTAVRLNRAAAVRRAMEAELREIEARFNLFMDEMPAIAWMKDQSGRYLYMNKAWAAVNDRKREDWIGRIPAGAIAPYEAVDLAASDADVAETGRFVELSGEWAGRRSHWHRTTFSFQSASGQRLVGGIAIDVTEQREVEQALQHSEVNYRTLVDAASEGILISDRDGRFRDVNPLGCRMLGYTRDELLGLTRSDIVMPGEIDRLAPEMACLTAGQAVRSEWSFRRKDGTLFAGEVSATILPDGRLLGIFRDSTERRQAEDESRRLLAVAERSRRALLGILEDQQRAEESIRQLNEGLERRVAERTAQLEAANKELEAFSYSVSHDLRAPLRAVDGFSQAMIEDFAPQLPEEAQRYLRTIRQGAQRMGALIDDLLTFARLSRLPLNKQTVDTKRMVCEVLGDLGPERAGRDVEIHEGPLPPCQGDPALLRQVWINLLSNALKFTATCKTGIVQIGCVEEHGERVYFVRDNGAGFDMQYAGKLFGVFQRLHRTEDYEGTGVGLAIVQRVVQRHGGRVWADGVEGRGATFYFTVEEAITQ